MVQAYLNTQGWACWWKQAIQWMARMGDDGVFIDNANFWLFLSSRLPG
jgi:hypothetical protein